MIRLLRASGSACDTVDAAVPGFSLPTDVVWIDLFEPTPEEDAALKKSAGAVKELVDVIKV